MNHILYLIKKIRQVIRHTLSSELSEFARMIRRNHASDAPASVGFYLNNSLFIHLGDQLFFEPAIRLASGRFDVRVNPTPDMKEYFIKSGVKIVSDDLFDCDVVVTREELLPDVLPKTKADIISINTLSGKMRYRISEAIARSVAFYLKIEIPETFDFSPWKPSSREKVEAEKIILAPYVDSGWFRVWKSDVEQLASRAGKYAEETGLPLCLVGGKSDAASGIPSAIKCDFEDWRGKYSPLQFAQILASGRVARVFTFDTFVFHAATAYGVPATVKIRRSFPKKRKLIKEHILPSYAGAGQQIDFL